MQNRDPQLETSGKIIGFYEREFYVFSNFSSFRVKWRGKDWQTSEYAYQAAKFFKTAPEISKKIYEANSAHEAFKLAIKYSNKKDPLWNKKRVKVMEDICHHKLEQNPYVKKKLFQTKNLKLIEDSPKDAFWGWGKDKNGENQLGKIWMKLRKEIKN